MEPAETPVTRGGNGRDDSGSGEPSVSSSLEHLVAGSQGMITKRIDLALLEGQELLSRSVERAALVGAGMVLGVVAWFAGAAACVLFVTPDASWVMRFAAFGVLNGAAAVGLVTLAMRHSRPAARERSNGKGLALLREPPPGEGKH